MFAYYVSKLHRSQVCTILLLRCCPPQQTHLSPPPPPPPPSPKWTHANKTVFPVIYIIIIIITIIFKINISS